MSGQRDALADQLMETQFAHLAPLVRACHRFFKGWLCPCCRRGKATSKHSCDCRLCPFEARERSIRLQKRFKKAIKGKVNLKFVTLTIENARDGELAGRIKELRDAWLKLKAHPLFKLYVRGTIAHFDYTYSVRRDGRNHHPHLHVLIDSPRWIPRDLLGEAWRECTRNARTLTPDIRMAKVGAERELLKYVTKIADLLALKRPEIIEEFLEATHRVRFLSTSGSFYRLSEDEIEEEKRAAEDICPDCGSQMLLFANKLSIDQVELDENGDWRPFKWAIPNRPVKTYRPPGPALINTVVLPIQNGGKQLCTQLNLSL